MENKSLLKNLVSIVIPSYNHQDFVLECIKSVIEQDYKDIELIIIDDGSSDDSVEKIRSIIALCEARFVRFHFIQRENRGLCATLNEAIKWCRGEYFSCVASDDILKKNKVSKQVKYLNENPSTIGVFGKASILLNDKEIITAGQNYKYNFNDIFHHLFSLPAPTQLIRLDAIIKVNGYDESIKIEDWYMWLKLTENGGTLDVLDEVVAVYRKHDNNMSNNIEKMISGRRQVLDKFKKNPKYHTALFALQLIDIIDKNNKNTPLLTYKIIIACISSPIKCLLFLKYFFTKKKNILKRNY